MPSNYNIRSRIQTINQCYLIGKLLQTDIFKWMENGRSHLFNYSSPVSRSAWISPIPPRTRLKRKKRLAKRPPLPSIRNLKLGMNRRSMEDRFIYSDDLLSWCFAFFSAIICARQYIRGEYCFLKMNVYDIFSDGRWDLNQILTCD